MKLPANMKMIVNMNGFKGQATCNCTNFHSLMVKSFVTYTSPVKSQSATYWESNGQSTPRRGQKYPPPTPRQHRGSPFPPPPQTDRKVSTTTGGRPLALTQEDFLVVNLLVNSSALGNIFSISNSTILHYDFKIFDCEIVQLCILSFQFTFHSQTKC